MSRLQMMNSRDEYSTETYAVGRLSEGNDVEFAESLAVMIFEKANGEIPKSICQTMAKNTTNRIRIDNPKENKSMEEYAKDCIWAYFQ